MAKRKSLKSYAGGNTQAKKTSSRVTSPSKVPLTKEEKSIQPQSRPPKTRKKSGPDTLMPRQPNFPIVGLGASAGGLEAFEEFFKHMAPDSGLAFVGVPHQHPSHTSLLPSLLQKYTTMPVMEMTDGLRVEPNRVYLAPAGKKVAILNGILQLMDFDPNDRIPLPIDYFFRSLAEDQKHQAIGIILSGTGTDGTLGLKAIKGESGMTMAQDPRSAKYAGMPQSAIAAGVVDYVQPAGQLPAQLLAYVKGPYLAPVPPPLDLETDTGQILHKIFVLLRDRTGNDFSVYKMNTLRRRIERRMNVHQIKNPKEYLRFLLANPHELDSLFQEFLIGVTSFFRDPAAFEVLGTHALPALLDPKQEGDPVRVWVAGCGSGEEAYSLAILLREYMERRKVTFHVQIFGTDLDSHAIDTARTGLYPSGIANDLTPHRLQRFFTKEDSMFRIKKEIRDLVIFAVHNLLADPPFTKLDILSCRNLLIYLEARAQRRLFPLFHHALKPNGLLFLGSSETIGGFEKLFRPTDKKWKVYTRKEGESLQTALAGFQVGTPKSAAGHVLDVDLSKPYPVPSISAQIESLLLEQFVPASVIVNERGEVVYIHGRTGAYLEPAPGQPNLVLLNMAREGLRYDLAAALQQAATQEGEVWRPQVRVKTNGEFIVVSLRVKRIEEPDALRGLFLVTFQPIPEAVSPPAQGSKPTSRKQQRPSNSGVLDELEYTKKRLQHTIEELQTSNEELKSTNEELQSTNEELQSTNEELETSKEELQSLNEELMTVNAELQAKMDELGATNDDLQNLLNSIEIATIFLDHNLNVKRFTAQAKRVVNLIPSDVGRPLADIASNLVDDQLIEEARDVLHTLVVKEREVRAKDGQWFHQRILPYRTAKNTIEGLVITFSNITSVKEAEIQAREAQEFAESIFQTVRKPLLVLDSNLCIVSANQAFYQVFQLTPAEVQGQRLYQMGHGEWNMPALRTLLEEVLPNKAVFHDFVVEQTFPDVGVKKLIVNGRPLQGKNTQPPYILLAMEDVTGRENRPGGHEEGAQP